MAAKIQILKHANFLLKKEPRLINNGLFKLCNAAKSSARPRSFRYAFFSTLQTNKIWGKPRKEIKTCPAHQHGDIG